MFLTCGSVTPHLDSPGLTKLKNHPGVMCGAHIWPVFHVFFLSKKRIFCIYCAYLADFAMFPPQDFSPCLPFFACFPHNIGVILNFLQPFWGHLPCFGVIFDHLGGGNLGSVCDIPGQFGPFLTTLGQIVILVVWAIFHQKSSQFVENSQKCPKKL